MIFRLFLPLSCLNLSFPDENVRTFSFFHSKRGRTCLELHVHVERRVL
jgi:hypothetical protein